MCHLARKSLALLAVWACWSIAGPARAGLLPVSATISSEGDNYRYTYGVVLTSDSTLHTGDFFTIYDFAGYVDGGAPVAGWTLTTANSGPTPGYVMPFDDPNTPNLTWTYNGPDGAVGQGLIDTFAALSSFEGATDGFFASLTHRQVDGHTEANVTDTQVPAPSIVGASDMPNCAPEPSAIVLGAVALSLVVGLRWLRRPTRTS
jgi:hypothetical protein